MDEQDKASARFHQEAIRIGAMLDAVEPEGAGAAALESLEEVVAGFGHYDGLPPEISLDDNGRSGKLMKALTYTGPDTTAWPVPVGAWLDGASIPPALWSIVGSPYTGKYRNASIIHDHFCVVETRSWQNTHRMFHDAMRCSGVGKLRASVMFYAVYRFGPRWAVPGLEAVAPDAAPEPFDAAAAQTLREDAETIMAGETDLDTVAALADTRRAERADVPFG